MAEPLQDCRSGALALHALARGMSEAAERAASVLDPGAHGRPLRRAVVHLAMRAAVASILRERGLRPAPSALFAANHPDSPDPFRRALCALEAEVGTPEDTALRAMEPEQLASLYPELLCGSRRKSEGVYYTGSELCASTTRRTLAPLIARGCDPLRLRVCDPAMGTGRFLASALDILVAALGDDSVRTRRAVATRCLHGRDQDPTAAALAPWVLWFQVDDPDLPIARLERNLEAGDGLADLPRGRFHAVLGNPPWETVQPSAAEFFSELDSGFRGLGKQAALRRQSELLGEDECAAREWDAIRAERRALRDRVRTGGFEHQGRGKLFTYRLFVEMAYHLLQDGGRLGLIVPSGLYADREAAPLRRLLLDRCRWEWLFVFENRLGLFPIDSRYRFGPIVAQKGGRTRVVRAAFLRRDPSEWDRPRPPALRYTRQQIRRLSPRHEAFLEIRHARDLEILERMQSRGVSFLQGTGATMEFAQGDFNMTSDSRRFVKRSSLEDQGYRCDPDARWLRGPDDRVYLPLFQGVMLGVLRANTASHVSGAGRRARWRTGNGVLEPQYLVREEDYRQRRGGRRHPLRLVFRTLSNATNARTAVATVLADLPCGNSIGILTPTASVPEPLTEIAFGAGVMASLAYDWALRQRMSGTNLNAFLVGETTWPRADRDEKRHLARLVLEICLGASWENDARRACRLEGLSCPASPASEARRRSLMVELELVVARMFGLRREDLAWMLRDCDHDARRLASPAFTRELDPKGFWRVDRDLPPHRRMTVQVLQALPGGLHRRNRAVR